MVAFFPLVFLLALAGRVLSFNITVGTMNLTISQILDIPDSPVKTACDGNCSIAQDTLQKCNDDTTCLCQNDTVAALLTCEQCMFTTLINTNKPKPDFRAGSTPVLSAYSASCKAANITLAPAQVGLQLPTNWDGPFVAILPFGAAIFTAIVGGTLGISAIFILSNM